eukprot:m.347714 g.347714  ORF g.347714 m.347714 type:complete len:107 (+) comp16562_c0_seq10:1386-1706(+)
MYPFIDLATFPRRYGHRTGMLLAILFAGITYQSFVTDVLPRVPYMTCADKFVLLCLSASVFVLFETFFLFKYRTFARCFYYLKFWIQGRGSTWSSDARVAVNRDWT